MRAYPILRDVEVVLAEQLFALEEPKLCYWLKWEQYRARFCEWTVLVFLELGQIVRF